MVSSNRCQNCCACCQFCGEPPFATQAEYDNLPPLLLDSLLRYYDKLRMMKSPSRGVMKLPCMWLNIKSGLCRYYNYRPLICSNFEIGGIECQLFIKKIYGFPNSNAARDLYVKGSY